MRTIENTMSLSDRQRFEMLATDTNRQFAHAVIYGGLTPREASAFCGWVMREDRTEFEPKDNLDGYLRA